MVDGLEGIWVSRSSRTMGFEGLAPQCTAGSLDGLRPAIRPA